MSTIPRDGHLICSNCNGEGAHICPDCEGAGEVICNCDRGYEHTESCSCDDGQTECFECGGTGDVLDPDQETDTGL